MNRIGLVLMALVSSAGCKGKPGPAVPGALEPTEELPVAGAEWALTRPMVEGYLRYQRTLLVQAGQLAAPAWDGGGLKQFQEPSVEQKAELDERARLEAGLTIDDVLKIEAMLSRVSARRLTFRLMRMDDRLPELPDPDPEDSTRGAELTRELQRQVQQRKSFQDLSEERAAFGSRNIDVLLQREEELLKNWSLMMEVPELAEPRR